MADIKLSIVNQAITAASEDPLTTLTPGSPMANAAIENYEAFVTEELENGSWKFATKDAPMSLLTAQATGRLKYQWQLPSDVLNVQAVLHCGHALEGEHYDIEGTVVRTCQNLDISLRYVFRPDEQFWPQHFRRIITQRLEALFLRVSERGSDANQRDQDTEFRKTVARHTESRQRNNRPLGKGTIAEARLGRHSRRLY